MAASPLDYGRPANTSRGGIIFMAVACILLSLLSIYHDVAWLRVSFSRALPYQAESLEYWSMQFFRAGMAGSAVSALLLAAAAASALARRRITCTLITFFLFSILVITAIGAFSQVLGILTSDTFRAHDVATRLGGLARVTLMPTLLSTMLLLLFKRPSVRRMIENAAGIDNAQLES